MKAFLTVSLVNVALIPPDILGLRLYLLIAVDVPPLGGPVMRSIL